MDSKTPLDSELAALFAEERDSAGGGPHPEPDELLKYLEGDLPEEAGRRLRDHLEGCRDCTEALLGIETLAGPDEPPSADGAADFELAAAWRKFRKQTSPASAPREKGRRWWPRGAPKVAAAVFFAATVGLTWQVARLRDALDERRAPQANVPVLYLEPTRDEGGFDARLEPGRGAEVFVVFLLLSEPGAFSEYQVDVLDAGGEPLWTGEDLEPSESGSLRIALSRGFLAKGEYRVRLYGVTGGGREPLDDYRIEIR